MSDQIHEGATAAAPTQPGTVWDSLRRAREARQESLQQVSAHLKLTVRQLEAIERGDLSVLPGSTFARGFVRNYARYLDLDPAVFLAASAETGGHAAPDLPEQMLTPSLGRMPGPGAARFSSVLPAGLVVLVLAIVLGAGWHFGWFESREDVALLEVDVAQSQLSESAESAASAVPASVESVPVDASASAVSPMSSAPVLPVSASSEPVAPMISAPVASQGPVPVSQESAAASQPAAAVAASGLPRLILSFEGESWVSVRDLAGKVVYARLNQPGSIQEVQGTPPFDLVIGNATQVRLNWKGRPVDLAPLTRGDVARVTLQ